MQAACAGVEFYVGVFAVGWVGAVPQASTAMSTFFALKDGQVIVAERDGLAGAHGDAGFLFAGDAELFVEEDDVIGEAGYGLDFAAHQQCILVRDQQAAIEGNLWPAAGGEQGIVERTAVCEGYGCGFFRVRPSVEWEICLWVGGCVRARKAGRR